jgi:hypothetical protein
MDSVFKQPRRNKKPSLRAQAKQPIARRNRKLDCFVASAPRNDVEEHSRDAVAPE